MKRRILIVLVGHVLAGCGGSGFSTPPLAPSAVLQPLPSPSPAPTPPLSQWAVFTDPATGFSTSDVHDAQGEVIRFNTADELVWIADGTRFPEFIAVGNFIGYHHANDRFFQVRFGTKNGERRAYLTAPDDGRGAAPTILDVWIDGHGDLKFAETGVRVPI